MKKNKILLVEDDKNLAFVIQDNLELHHYEVILCEDGEKAWNQFHQTTFDLCLLDVMLPMIDGFTLAQKIRSKDQEVPIFFLTARGLKEDKITGFKNGADDYITKPFSIEELLLRMAAILKRTGKNNPPPTHCKIGHYLFDQKNLFLKGPVAEYRLTQREADILQMFVEKEGEIVKRQDLLTKVWGDDDYFMGRSMDVFISKLRKYLKEDPAVEIVNIHGIGFKMLVRDKN